MTSIKKSFSYGEHTVTIETGEIAKQATASALVDMAGTVVLVTLVAVPSNNSDLDFFPLTVNYQERAYAAGKVPGGYFKREGRPSEKEILTARLIDRPIRPLAPKGFNYDVQIIATVLSLNPEVDADVPSLLGSAAVLALSGMPMLGQLSAARVGYINGEYVLNPSFSKLANSALDMVVAGTEQAVLMVESEAKELSEAVMLGAVSFAHKEMQHAIVAIKELVKEAGILPWDWHAPSVDTAMASKVTELVQSDLEQAYQVSDKISRQDAVASIREQAVEKLCGSALASPIAESDVRYTFSQLERKIVRSRILRGLPRIDGRDTKTVRPIQIRTGLLPRAHGSVLFTRGETQALVVTTLGTERDAQSIDALRGEQKETFMLHYNFPPYSVGETGQVGSPKRREIGHGNLAKRGVCAVLPVAKEFPYVLRVVSEITESNGSSSMASVCGASLSLMDAGVPIKRPVSGVAMGLVKEDNEFAVLTDILGDEDHLGDMDFKVAGTREGITALQMDIKINGITEEIMRQALDQANAGRLHILDVMERAMPNSRQEMSAFAPRIVNMKIPADKIRDLIGKGGATIRALTEETGTVIDIDDDGSVRVSAADLSAIEEAKRRIELLTTEVLVGQVYEGTVTKLMEFGAIVSFLPGKQGLVHISQIANERIAKVSDHLSEGQQVRVKVLEIDRQGRIRLSMKEVESQGEVTPSEGE